MLRGLMQGYPYTEFGIHRPKIHVSLYNLVVTPPITELQSSKKEDSLKIHRDNLKLTKRTALSISIDTLKIINCFATALKTVDLSILQTLCEQKSYHADEGNV